MSPRKRKAGNEDLPLYLYGPDGRGRYRYERPGRPVKYITEGREAAINAARAANEYFDKHPDLVSRLTERVNTLQDFIGQHWEDIKQEREWAPSTRKDYEQKLSVLLEAFGGSAISAIDLRSITDFLNQFPATQRNRYRSFMMVIWKYAVAEGWTSRNTVADTLQKKLKVKRQRLTLEDYRAIHDHAERHIQDAMDLALHTLQRRSDIASLDRTAYRDGCLYIIQRKTGRALQIEADAPLQAVLKRCLYRGALSRRIVHKDDLRGVSAEVLTRGFARARDKAGIVVQEGHTPPSFHEIRALGSRLLEKAGTPFPMIQALLGHKSENMTHIYLSRHEVEWIKVSGGIEV